MFFNFFGICGSEVSDAEPKVEITLDEDPGGGIFARGLEAPKLLRPLQYEVSACSLLGVPLRTGRLLLIMPGLADGPKSSAAVKITLSLHINGFSFGVLSDASENSREVHCVFSPFYSIRCVAVAGHKTYAPRVFKVNALQQPDRTFYFGCEVEQESQAALKTAEKDRTDWVNSFAHSVQIVTQSLWPIKQLDPLDGEAPPSSSYSPREVVERPVSPTDSDRRLIWGSLAYLVSNDEVAILWCELLAPGGTLSESLSIGRRYVFRAWESDGCTNLIFQVVIQSETQCAEMNGLQCACFELEGRHFSARSPGERRVWLRALFNCKVRIMNDAPIPDAADLTAFRTEIMEMHEAWCSNLSRAPTIGRGPLLARSKHQASQAHPEGDRDPLPLLAPPEKLTIVGTFRPDDDVWSDKGEDISRPAPRMEPTRTTPKHVETAAEFDI